MGSITRCFLFLFILSLFIGGCKKNSDHSSGTITGTWELRETSAAMNPNTSKYSPGNGNKLDFTGTDYKIYKSGQLIKSGQFTVIQDSTVEDYVCLVLPKGQYTNRLIYDSNYTATKVFFHIS